MTMALGSLRAHRAVVDVEASSCILAGGKVLGGISTLGKVSGTVGPLCQEHMA